MPLARFQAESELDPTEAGIDVLRHAPPHLNAAEKPKSMKIYTRKGDTGETSLLGGGRVGKNDGRVDAYGEVDELSAVLGVVAASLDPEHEDIRQIQLIQEDLLAIGAHLAAISSGANSARNSLPPLPAERIPQMEEWIDAADKELDPLTSFILPGGTESAALYQLARAVCRRAERSVTTLAGQWSVDEKIFAYLNRLSDLLFTRARLANHRSGRPEIKWKGRAADGATD